MAEEEINLPSLVIVLLITGLAVRYFFFSGNASTAHRQPGGTGGLSPEELQRRREREREAAVETIQQMFPQVDRRTILWDLQRHGGNLQATTERILAGRTETVSFASFTHVPGVFLHTLHSAMLFCLIEETPSLTPSVNLVASNYVPAPSPAHLARDNCCRAAKRNCHQQQTGGKEGPPRSDYEIQLEGQTRQCPLGGCWSGHKQRP